jgi:hypothetical protein
MADAFNASSTKKQIIMSTIMLTYLKYCRKVYHS